MKGSPREVLARCAWEALPGGGRQKLRARKTNAGGVQTKIKGLWTGLVGLREEQGMVGPPRRLGAPSAYLANSEAIWTIGRRYGRFTR